MKVAFSASSAKGCPNGATPEYDGLPGLDGDARRARIDAEADRLIALGAAVTERFDTPDDIHLILQDPEGNEFCLA